MAHSAADLSVPKGSASETKGSEISPRAQYDDKRRAAFLKELALTSNISRSASTASLALSTIYKWRETDSGFAKAWQTALLAGYETLEMELLNRARCGVEKPVYLKGEIIATTRHYNDAIALRLLLAHKDMVAKTRAAQSETLKNAGDIRRRVESKIRQMQKRIAKRRAQDGE